MRCSKARLGSCHIVGCPVMVFMLLSLFIISGLSESNELATNSTKFLNPCGVFILFSNTSINKAFFSTEI